MASRVGAARPFPAAGLAAFAAVTVVAASLSVVFQPRPAAAEPPEPCIATAPHAAAAAKAAEDCGGRVEILADRSEVSQTFANADGTHTVEIGIEPERVRKGASWVPIDTNLKATGNGVSPRASALPVTLSNGGRGPLATIEHDGRKLSISWPGKLPKPVLLGDTALYRDVLPDVDLRVTAHALGFSELLVVRSRAAARNPKLRQLRFGLVTKGVKVAHTEGGGLAARDRKGNTVFTAPAPLMWDSSVTAEPTGEPQDAIRPPAKGKGMAAPRAPKATAAPEPTAGVGRHAAPAGGPASAAPPTDTRQRTAGSAEVEPGRSVMPVKVNASSLTLVPDQKLLTDPDAKLPIYIDPSVSGNVSAGAWTSVWSKHKGSSFWKNSTALTNGKTFGSAGSGRTEDCSGCADHIVRSFFRMEIGKARGTIVKSATFRIEQKHAWTCNPKSNAKLWLTGGISDKTTWNKQPAWNGNYTAQSAANRKVGSAHGCLGAGPVEFNVTSMVKKVAEVDKASTMTVGLRAVDEGTRNQWKRFNHSSPKLSITYNNLANAPADRKSDGKPCATGGSRPYVLTTTPILSAKQADVNADQQNVRTDFHWWPHGGMRNDNVKISQSAGNPSSVSPKMPAQKLSDGGTYVWQARTWDGMDYGPWSGTCEFTVDATPPPMPGDIDAGTYRDDDKPHGGVGTEDIFRVSPPSVRPHEVNEYAWTLDSGVLANAKPAKKRADHGAEIPVTPLHDGVNVLRVWARDHAGRYSEQPSTYTFTVRAGDGPAAEWTFDEAAGDVEDISRHGNTLVLGGSATRVVGRAGQGRALSLNGSTAASTAGPVAAPHPETGAATPIRTDADFTVTARIKLPATGGAAQQTIISANGSRTFAYSLGYAAGDNRWRFAMAGSDTDNPMLYSVLSDAAPLPDRWTHLAARYDASARKLQLFVNGVAQQASATLTGGFNATAGVSIGKRRWNGGDDSFFTGVVDDVRVYNFAETDANIASLAVPLPAAITFPNGADAKAGGKLAVTFDAGGDTNVTKYRYSLEEPHLDREATPGSAGGPAALSIDIGTRTGDRLIYVAAVDSAGRVSPTVQAEFSVTAAAALSGTVIDAMTFEPVADATVTLQPGRLTVRTDAGGGYRFTGFAPGPYTVSAQKGGPCGLTGTSEVTVDDDAAWLDLYVFPYRDDLGYTCTERVGTLTAGATALALTGDDAVKEIDLPFAFPFYGQVYRSAFVDTNGLVSFDDPAGSHRGNGGALPAPLDPNALVAPFWDDLVVDGAASVRTATVGAGDGQRFVIQWQNVHRKESAAQRLSFEVELAATGEVTFDYDGLEGDAERGAAASVGIEAPDGADGLTYSAAEPALADGRSIAFENPEDGNPLELHDLVGRVLNADGSVAAGVKVSLDPSGQTTTTTANGSWRFENLVADSYTVSATRGGRCALAARAQVELAADTAKDLRLGPDYGGLGYACATGASGYVAANTVVPLTGDDAAAQVSLPFPVTVHGRSHTSAWVSTNGFVSFGSDLGKDNYANPTMPTAATPNAVVAPFWDDFKVDGSASVRTQLTGTAPNRAFVVEWRNVTFRPAEVERVTFEAMFHENGQISFHYGTLDNPEEQGAAATVGIENASGTVAALYSFHQAVLTGNSSITYTPAPVGELSGTVSVAVAGTPMAGATVRLEPGGRTATTDAEGRYAFTGLPVGEYAVAASAAGNRCAGQYAKETFNHAGGVSDLDLSLMVEGDEFGYTCTSGTTAFVPGAVAEGWSGDETVWQKNPPFPVKLYGEAHTSAWISANGLVSFKDPAYFGWIGSAPNRIPSLAAEGLPNAAVYAHWDDWVVDAQAKIVTGTSGTAPNRRWVVEWRNVHLYGDTNARATFEAIFHEGGDITLAYSAIPAANAVARGAGATVGIENASGTIGFEYLHKEALLAAGQGITFKPNPPGHGVISGTVTCQGTAVAGAAVAAAGQSVTTAATGAYRIENVPAGTYAVVATRTGGECRGSSVEQTVVGTKTEQSVSFAAVATPPGAGYTLAEQPVAYAPIAGTVLPITGDDAYTPVSLPFPVTHYGQTYTNGWVDSNGLLAFVDPGESSSDAWPIPSPRSPQEPNAAIYPFWHDWVVDAEASVRTVTRGSGTNRQFVVEWRNVHSYEDPNTRVTFQLVIDESGGYSFAYTDIAGTFLERGGGATIGIENADGTVALQYTYRQPVLRPGLGLRINRPAP